MNANLMLFCLAIIILVASLISLFLALWCLKKAKQGIIDTKKLLKDCDDLLYNMQN